MRLYAKAVLLIPVWLLVTIVLPFFPKSHPWHGKTLTLMSWAHCATPVSVAWSAGVWIMTVVLTTSIWCLSHEHTDMGCALAVFNSVFAFWLLHKIDNR